MVRRKYRNLPNFCPPLEADQPGGGEGGKRNIRKQMERRRRQTFSPFFYAPLDIMTVREFDFVVHPLFRGRGRRVKAFMQRKFRCSNSQKRRRLFGDGGRREGGRVETDFGPAPSAEMFSLHQKKMELSGFFDTFLGGGDGVGGTVCCKHRHPL